MEMMERILTIFLEREQHVDKCSEELEGILQSWAVEDRSKTNPTENEFFPTVIRGYGEDEFPLVQRPAVLTQYGMDAMLNAGSKTAGVGVQAEDFDNGFVTQVDRSPSISTSTDAMDTNRYVDLNGVRLKLNPTSKVSGVAHKDAGVSFTESWVDRWSEARRYTPFTMCSSYLTWLSLLDQSELSWDTWVERGAKNLLLGVSYLACEWACRSCPRILGKKKKLSIASLLKAWRSDDKTFAVPSWMAEWRKPMSYSYVTAADVGYASKKEEGRAPDSLEHVVRRDIGLAEWSRQTLGEAIGGDQVPETRMPFVERSDGGFPLQSSALTTMGPLRFYLCFSVAMETCGSLHLPKMNEYYMSVNHYLGKNPGRVGRKLGKVVVQMARLLLADVSLDVPLAQMPKGEVTPFVTELQQMHIDDNYARDYLLHNNREAVDAIVKEHAKREVSVSQKHAIAMAICDKAPELTSTMYEVFKEYGGSDAQINKYHVTSFSHRKLDVITHMMSAGSVEGYVRSCQGSLPVSGYKSYTQRRILEGLDTSASTRAVDQFERGIWDQIMPYVSIPSYTDMYHDMHNLSNSKSSGGDRIRIANLKRGTILGDATDTVSEGFSSNRKDVMHLDAALKISKEYMMIKAPPEAPFPVGQRSVPARKLRYIYNLPIPQQIALYRLYKAMVSFMETDDVYSLTHREGVPIFDSCDEINASIMLAMNPLLTSLAIDASSLDQHIGIAHRRIWLEALEHTFGGQVAQDVLTKLGVDYKDIVKNTVESWNDSYYSVPVKGAPEQLLHVDTQPSGALTTAVDNSLATKAMTDMMENVCEMKFLIKRVWGDDFYGIVQIPADETTVNFTDKLDAVGSDAGQVLGTTADSTSGRCVHYLQKAYVGGQIISRRMAYDHENEVGGARMPGMIGEFLDKARDLCVRGGNKTLLNMLQLLTVINGSRATQYGRQALVKFDTMAAAGGTLNRLLVGFNSPNSKLYLELNAAAVLDGELQSDLQPKPKVEVSYKVGRRVLDDKDQVVKCKVGGVETAHRLGELQDSADKALLDPSRVKHRVSEQLQGALGTKITRLSYANSVRGGAEMAVGDVLTSKHLLKKFREKALRDSNYIGSSLRDKPEAQVLSTSSIHTGLRVGRYLIKYALSDQYILKLPRNPKEQFCLLAGAAPLQHFPQHWHPYYTYPRNYRMLMSLLGIHTSARQELNVKNFIKRFSPGRFRKDITAEEVMEAVKHTPPALHRELLTLIGFSDGETESAMGNIANIPLYQDIAKADDYASMPDIAKSCSSTVMRTILQTTSSAAMAEITSLQDIQSVILSHSVSLLADELNVVCTLQETGSGGYNFIRLPTVSISRV
jgi:hypothetical protein